MRILHVIASLAPRYGGPSKVLPEMCRALAARGHDVEIFTTNVDGPTTLPVPVGVPQALDGVTVTYFDVHWPRYYKASFGLGRALHDQVDSFDVVHVHSLYLFHTSAASFYAHRHRVPYVIRPHGTLDPYQRARHRGRKAVYDLLIERRNLDRAGGIHCTSLAEKSAIEPLRLSAPCFVVPLGVEVPEVEQTGTLGDGRRTCEEFSGREYVTFVGRLSLKKGLDILLQAFAQVRSLRPDAHLVIAGPDDEGLGRRLHAHVRRLRLESRVSFRETVTGQAKADLLRRSSVFVLASMDENFGVSVVEAMAARVPVVLTSGVAIHREITEAEAGLVVPRTPAAVASAILRLLNDPVGRRRLGENGRRLVETSFTWPRIASQLEQMYQAVSLTPATMGSAGRGR
jgi:glycosyltransferase involved in cell wall biosynthesis